MEYSVREFAPHSNPALLLPDLDSTLAPRVYLVGYYLTLADIAVFSALKSTNTTLHYYFIPCYSLSGVDQAKITKFPNLTRWYNHVSEDNAVKSALKILPSTTGGEVIHFASHSSLHCLLLLENQAS